MEQIKIKTLLLAGVITLAASMFAGCTEEVTPATEKSEPIVIKYTDIVANDGLTPGTKTRSLPDNLKPVRCILVSKTGNKLYASCTESPWPSGKAVATWGTKVSTSGISCLGVCASVYASSSSYTSAGCGSYFYKESVVSGTPMTYYWPTSNYKISFFGYYPYNSAAFTVQSAASATGAPTYAYTVPSAIASQQDIMTGQVTDRPGGSASVVNMTLSHRCAAIRFNITNDRSEAITVNSISIEGVKYTGTLNENTWTVGDAVNSSSSNPFTLTCNTSVAAEATADITGTSNIFMMLPQTLPSGAKLKVVVDDEEFETEISGSWAQGCSYTYTISMSEDDTMPIGTVLTYGFTGIVQSVELPAGQYKLQCWGAQGGNAKVVGSSSSYNDGGKGGYSEGIICFNNSTTIYIFVGGQGLNSTSSMTGSYLYGGWNGGGSTKGNPYKASGTAVWRSYIGSGGGSTDMCFVTSSMNRLNGVTNRSNESIMSRFIVAGGGSGATSYGYTSNASSGSQWNDTRNCVGYYGGGREGGGTYGGDATYDDCDYYFGRSETKTDSKFPVAGAGGSGWKGGYTVYSGTNGYLDNAGGGSGYINVDDDWIWPDEYAADHILFSSGFTSGGNESFPKTSGTGFETGHSGNGYAKITRLN